MQHTKIVHWIGFILGIATGAFTQVAGFVYDYSTLQPISGAQVTRSDTNWTVVTDGNGFFTFSDNAVSTVLAPQGALNEGVGVFRAYTALGEHLGEQNSFSSLYNQSYNQAIVSHTNHSAKGLVYMAKPMNSGYITVAKQGFTTVQKTVSAAQELSIGMHSQATGNPLQWQPQDCHIAEESVELARLVNEYRVQNQLPEVPLSAHLFQVAHIHTRDLVLHNPVTSQCNMHSWSGHDAVFGKSWSAMCYTKDHEEAQKMWDKPREISNGVFTGNGYENSAQGGQTPKGYLDLWKSSSGHNAVILNQGIWNDFPWKSMGVSIYEGYAVLWFSDKADSRLIHLCE